MSRLPLSSVLPLHLFRRISFFLAYKTLPIFLALSFTPATSHALFNRSCLPRSFGLVAAVVKRA